VRIDACEGNRHVGILVRELGDLLVRDFAGFSRTIHGEDDERHPELAVHVGHLWHGLVLRLVAEVAAHRFLRLRELVVHGERRLPRVRVDVDGNELREVHARSTLGESE
jgi:hypothetical protein